MSNDLEGIRPDDVLHFWFEELAQEAWFKVDPALDERMLRRFGLDYEGAAIGGLDSWSTSAEGALALTIMLDQFPRNMFRGTPRAFSSDPKARTTADSALAQGFDRMVEPARRGFFYLPFEHSEDLADQERSVALFEKAGDPILLEWAVKHLRIIERFGRFPHRNHILGRESTPEEAEFLTQPDSSF